MKYKSNLRTNGKYDLSYNKIARELSKEITKHTIRLCKKYRKHLNSDDIRAAYMSAVPTGTALYELNKYAKPKRKKVS